MCTRRVVEDEVLFDAGSCSGGVGEEQLDDVLDYVRFISPSFDLICCSWTLTTSSLFSHFFLRQVLFCSCFVQLLMTAFSFLICFVFFAIFVISATLLAVQLLRFLYHFSDNMFLCVSLIRIHLTLSTPEKRRTSRKAVQDSNRQTNSKGVLPRPPLTSQKEVCCCTRMCRRRSLGLFEQTSRVVLMTRCCEQSGQFREAPL